MSDEVSQDEVLTLALLKLRRGAVAAEERDESLDARWVITVIDQALQPPPPKK